MTTSRPIPVCVECGNDDAHDGHRYCTDCLEVMEK